MREPFLFYTENVMMTTEEKEAKAARRYVLSFVEMLPAC